MRKTKLTVRIPQDVLDNFRRYAEEKNTTMTSLVEAYLRRIPHQELPEDAPIVRRLSGTLSNQVSIEDHKKHLAEKYGG
jgi:antitoxin component of RelBE/YafQ-DinJ toxin-antitoxin module